VNYAPDWGEGNLFSIVEGESRAFEAGMVFHLVPGIYVPPEFVVVISETVVVTNVGAEVVTDFPRQLFSC
jgi:Xaa-Pro dipeptidase